MKKIYWGVILVAAAVLILLSALGIDIGFIGVLPITDILLSVILLAILVGAVVDRAIWFIPYPLAVIFMLFETEIADYYVHSANSNLISNWLVLLCALLLSIGLSLIFSKFTRFGKKSLCGKSFCFSSGDDRKHEHRNFEGKDGRSVHLSSETKYIDCTNFESFFYKVRMGSGSIYFENPENYTGGGTLTVDCKMGDMTINVPHTWQLKADIFTSMGDTEIPDTTGHTGPLLTIVGENKMGDITVRFC